MRLLVRRVLLALLLSLLLSPTGLYAALQRLFAATGRAAGRITTWLVMVPLFYLFFLPFGRLLRRGRRDRLKRSFDRAAGSYWRRSAASFRDCGGRRRPSRT